MNKVQFALEAFKNIQELIKFTDQKTGAVLVLSGLLLTALQRLSKDLDFVGFTQPNFLNIIIFLSGTLTFLSLFITIYISINKILKPRLAKNYNKSDFSYMYFEHISNVSNSELKSKYSDLNEELMLESIISQQREVSKILVKKIEFLNLAFKFLFSSIVFLTLFLLTLGAT